ncbi:DNA polymerase III subunit epsilon [Candidatus Magnetaquicoccaceae bacterium FCR-1]|uniref:DNA polymerase III subunit epsilon n=1 Tax=Candidatus Magnetaquiglobus chichijimensis TaxID=3141448 RepID=A0ABQ0CCB8_9PROT
MTRLIALDTETTGLSPNRGDRIVEIGCVELIHMRKGATRQWFINPERPIPAEATRIHGITDEKVANEPIFRKIAEDFLAFIGSDQLVIYNAGFDLGFLNAELARIKRPLLDGSRVIDALMLARKRFPGAKADLDSVCKRLKIDNAHRKLHGALLDAELLAEVYVALNGGAQFAMDLTGGVEEVVVKVATTEQAVTVDVVRPVRVWPIAREEEQAHAAFLEFMQKEHGACLWTN